MADAVTPIVEDFKPSWLDKLKGLVARIVGRDTIDDAALQAIADKFEQQEAASLTSAKNAEILQSERERLEDQVGDLRRQLEPSTNVLWQKSIGVKPRRRPALWNGGVRSVRIGIPTLTNP